jgi:hypothetical protein
MNRNPNPAIKFIAVVWLSLNGFEFCIRFAVEGKSYAKFPQKWTWMSTENKGSPENRKIFWGIWDV